MFRLTTTSTILAALLAPVAFGWIHTGFAGLAALAVFMLVGFALVALPIEIIDRDWLVADQPDNQPPGTRTWWKL